VGVTVARSVMRSAWSLATRASSSASLARSAYSRAPSSRRAASAARFPTDAPPDDAPLVRPPWAVEPAASWALTSARTALRSTRWHAGPPYRERTMDGRADLYFIKKVRKALS
jgi:hypothetical protein